MSQPANLPDLLASCHRCGACRETCPSFQVFGRESTASRGRLALLEALNKGEIPADESVREALATCLLCARCETTCQVKTPTDQGVLLARSRLLGGASRWRRALFRLLLRNRKRFTFFLRLGYWFQKLLPTRRRGSARHLPLFFLGRGLLPALAPRPAMPGLLAPDKLEAPKETVALFVGCASNYVYASVALAAKSLLNRLGVRVIAPPDQNCCGLPALVYGDKDLARELADQNLAALRAAGIRRVVFICATCRSMMRRHYPALLERETEPEFELVDICQYLADDLKLAEKARRDESITVTYHDPCHLLDAGAAARKLLSAFFKLVEIPGPSACCGGAGSFMIFHPEAARPLGEKRARLAAGTGARYLASGCPGCLMQLQESLSRVGSPQLAVHPVELILSALDTRG